MSDAIRNRLLAVIAFVLLVEALRASYPVTMPLAVSIMIIAAIWPIKTWLDRFVPSIVSYLGTSLVLLLIVAGFIGAIYFSIRQGAQAFVADQARFSGLFDALVVWSESWGLPDLDMRDTYSRLIAVGQVLLEQAYAVTAYLGIIGVLVLLGLPEVPALSAKMRTELDRAERHEVAATVSEIAQKIRQYLGVTTLTSILTGVVTGLWVFVLGVDLAFLWGVLNFLLNYVPVIGNLIGIIPPTLYAMLQYDGWTIPIVMFVGLSIIQIVISNFVYPMVQGRSLALSPMVIVVALAFWSWVWGLAGALVAIPLTAAFIIACEHFPSTAWISTLLSNSASPMDAKTASTGAGSVVDRPKTDPAS